MTYFFETNLRVPLSLGQKLFLDSSERVPKNQILGGGMTPQEGCVCLLDAIHFRKISFWHFAF